MIIGLERITTGRLLTTGDEGTGNGMTADNS